MLGYREMTIEEEQFTQHHKDEKYLIGEFEEVEAQQSLIYKQGDICSAIVHQPARKAVVKFVCDANARKPHLASVQEVVTCEYVRL